LTPRFVVDYCPIVLSSELTTQLTRLGLTSYEARAYVALTGRDSFTAAQAARLSGVPRQRIYDVLGSLVGKGMASARPGTVVKYAATDPALAIQRLVASRREEFAELEDGAAAIIQDLTAAYEAGQQHTDPLEYIEVLRDQRAINARFDEIQAGIKREILIFTKPPYAKPPQENVEGLNVVRSHTARSIYEYSVFDDPDIAAGVRRFIDAGEQARFVAHLPLKLVIIDEAVVMFGMQDPVATGDLTMMVVEHPSLATLLKMAFNGYWDRGLTFDEAQRQAAAARSATPVGAPA
jgi:HTH-type transcriptional regulator, sugar sensing transcriptional regulator